MKATYRTPPPPAKSFLLQMQEADWHDLRWFLSERVVLQQVLISARVDPARVDRLMALLDKMNDAVITVTEEQ